jgi:hypothetical protein
MGVSRRQTTTRRQAGQDRVRLQKRVGRDKHLIAPAEAAFDLLSRSVVVLVLSRNGRDHAA